MSLMSAMAQQVVNNFCSLSESNQNFVANFIARIKKEEETGQENELHGIGYLKMVQSAIDEIANGGGTIRELIEVGDDE